MFLKNFEFNRNTVSGTGATGRKLDTFISNLLGGSVVMGNFKPRMHINLNWYTVKSLI